MFNPKSIRKDFPILKRLVKGKRLIYLDNAATSQKPLSVIDAQSDFYRRFNSNVHRGAYTLAEEATNAYEAARQHVGKFIHAPSETIVFTRNATEAINLVAASWGRTHLKHGDEILLSVMEHHSNLVPWQIVAKATGAKLRFLQMAPDFQLDLSSLSSLLTSKTKFVSVVHISNALGTINPVKFIIEQAHQVGAKVLIDASQSAPHHNLDITELDCDFLAFTGHKMLAPTGIGVLYGKKDLLDAMPPYMGGGEMIKEVQLEWASYRDAPTKFEAGTPNIAGAIGLSAAIDYLENIGLDNIRDYEDKLVRYGIDQIRKIPGITLYGPKDERAAILPFNIERAHAHDAATIMSEMGICVRAGHHCCQPLMRILNVPATARASLYFYNTEQEIDALIKGIMKVKEMF
jgi:cysteine desulfurase/selenocysteine lyase